ncbi:MAG: bifunctional 4-hydroxy-2-oxoglutarate aldolase/2-dehydro-3-deoxy-phosphogluconate aldolase [Fusobacterium sp.]|nr:bifunctional 4-hydroxy-2-oxoglutarate aldolase/2-dehydro-3-deoxy-phosphogluconate aldolase [Fusobacterium sp.]
MEKYIYNDTLIEIMKAQKIFPVLRGKDKNKMIDTARALAKAGIELVEINVDAPEIFEAIEEVSSEITVCAGGIITSLQAETAFQAGAKVFSSPIFQTNLLKISKSRKIPYIAGTTTANEAYTAWKSRIPLIKLYPITAMGGTMYLEDILRPMPFLNIMPVGNVKLSQVKDYINAGAISVGVGRDIYEAYTPDQITARMHNFMKDLNG